MVRNKGVPFFPEIPLTKERVRDLCVRWSFFWEVFLKNERTKAVISEVAFFFC